MNTKDRLNNELKMAMKMKDRIGAESIRLIKARITQAEKETGTALTEEQIQEVLLKAAKDYEKSITAYRKANRPDLVEKEESQLNYLKPYLPQEMTEEEITAAVREIILEIGTESIKDMGKVMREFNLKYKGRANGGLVAKTVKRQLN